MNNLFMMIVALLVGTGVQAASLDNALKVPHDPGYASVVLSLIFVICLIYATGIIYNKLNAFGIKTMKSQKDAQLDKIVIISTTPLGANRTLHVVELNGKKMLIGASANSSHLIKDLSESIEMAQVSQESFKEECMEEEISPVEDDEEFGLYKKYLR